MGMGSLGSRTAALTALGCRAVGSARIVLGRDLSMTYGAIGALVSREAVHLMSSTASFGSPVLVQWGSSRRPVRPGRVGGTGVGRFAGARGRRGRVACEALAPPHLWSATGWPL